MNIKKITALICSMALTVTAVTGCVGEKKKSDNSELVKLKMYYPVGGTIDDFGEIKDLFNEYVKEKINAEVEFETPDVSTYYSNYALKFQASEPVDIMWLNGSMLLANIRAKAFRELDELLDEYGAGIKEEVSPVLLDGAKINGKLYSIPVNKEYAIGYAMYYKKELADKYSLDVAEAKTYEQVGELFETIKKNEPSVTPYFMPKGGEVPKLEIEGISSTKYENVGGVGYILYDTEADSFVNLYDTEYYKKRFDYIRDWYKKGYINNDAATTTTTVGSAFLAGKAWTTYASAKPLTENLLSKDFGAELVRGFQTPITSDFSSATGSMLAIPYTSNNPERAMQLLNLLYTDEYLINLLVYGIEGKHYIKEENGKIKLPDGVTDLNLTGYNPGITWRVGNQKLNYLYDDEPDNKWELYDGFDAKSVESKITGFAFDNTDVRLESAAMSSVLEEYRSLLNTGSVEPEEALAELNKKMKDNGFDKILAEVEKQYAEWKGRK